MQPKDSSPSHLLLVDDEPIVLNTLATGLQVLGYQVTTCETPSSALASYQKNIPDLVVLDYRMPEMDGLQLARHMLEINHRPIIMLSAYNDLPLVRQVVDTGVSGYLVKPIEAERLAPSIEAALARFAELEAMLRQGANIQASVESQRMISTAVGIIMARTHRTQDLAFESLRKMARDQRRPLRELAFDLVDATSNANTILAQLSGHK